MISTRPATHQTQREFSVGIRIAVPPEGLGNQFDQMVAWLDANCGADSWSMAPSGTNGVANDALAIYVPNQAFARAFVSRWCIGCRVEV